MICVPFVPSVSIFRFLQKIRKIQDQFVLRMPSGFKDHIKYKESFSFDPSAENPYVAKHLPIGEASTMEILNSLSYR